MKHGGFFGTSCNIVPRASDGNIGTVEPGPRVAIRGQATVVIVVVTTTRTRSTVLCTSTQETLPSFNQVLCPEGEIFIRSVTLSQLVNVQSQPRNLEHKYLT